MGNKAQVTLACTRTMLGHVQLLPVHFMHAHAHTFWANAHLGRLRVCGWWERAMQMKPTHTQELLFYTLALLYPMGEEVEHGISRVTQRTMQLH